LKQKEHDVAPVKMRNTPKTFDWRSHGMVTPVKDQGACGSCWAFSATETIESAWMMKHGLNNNTMQPLSVQQIVDCDWGDYGCFGGEPEGAYAYIMSAGGQETNQDYPYDHVDKVNIWCEFDSTKIYSKVANWSYACSTGDEVTLMNNAYLNGPTSICVDAGDWSDYTGGILMGSDCGSDLDHCVQIVGWDLTNPTPYWIVRNSWGSDWGENGFIRLQYGQDTCGLTQEATNVFSA
jgi:cathepsin F